VKEYELLRKNFSDGGNFGGRLHKHLALTLLSCVDSN
jgi:hypothetical protein